MYTPAPFREERFDVLGAFIREHPLALLVDASLNASHVPMYLDSANGALRAHVARANPHWRVLHGAPVLAVFSGPSHYVSPSWYPSKAEHGRVVPTWNFVAVHIRGVCTVFEDESWLLRHLNEITAANEARIDSRWQVGDAPPDFIRGLAQTIAGIEIRIESIEGKWKLSQNRTEADREGVAAGLTSLGTAAAAEIAALMRRP